jgi:hypothetical protein
MSSPVSEGMTRMGRKVVLFVISSSILLSSLAYGYEWQAGQALRGWGLYNATAVPSGGGGVLFSKQAGAEDMVIYVPLSAGHGGSFVPARLRTMSIDTLVVCALMSQGRVLASEELPLFSGEGWRESDFNFEGMKFHGEADTVALSFRHCDSVEIKDIAVQGPSFSEVFAHQGLKAYNVNLLYPFTVYGHSLNLWLYALITVAGLGVAVFYSVKRRGGAVAVVCAVLLFCYLALDLREIYDEAAIVKSTYDNALLPTPSEKRFRWNDNLVEFADLIRRNVRPGEQRVEFYGDETRYLYMRYLLYPIELVRGKDSPSGICIFSEIDNAALDGDRLLVNGQVYLDGGTGIPFSPHSFVYVTR